MLRYVLFNKPFQVLTQFTDKEQRSTLADYISIPNIYSAGRLDFDSEGLLLMTDDGALIHALMDPKHKVEKTYYAQVEGIPNEHQIEQLQCGLQLKDGMTRPCSAKVIVEPTWLWDRNPPIRERQSIPTSWLELTITEGRNRQVRRMTAAVGLPTLRLIRTAIGQLCLDNLAVGEARELSRQELIDNGINWTSKKTALKTMRSPNGIRKKPPKRWGSRPHRSRSTQNQNRTV